MKKLLLVVVLICVALTAAAYWVSPSGTGSEKGYTFDEVTYGSLVDKISATGTVWPHEVAYVFSDAPGKVDKVLVDFNAKVHKDQPLVKLRTDLAQHTLDRVKLALERAKYLREAAQSGWDQALPAYNKGYLKTEDKIKAESTLKAAKAGVDEAEEAVKQAQEVLDRMTIKAPISGIILNKTVKEGKPVSPIPSPTLSAVGNPLAGNPLMGMASSSPRDISAPGSLFTIVKDFKDMEVDAQILQSDISKITIGQEAIVTVDDSELSDADRQFMGKVEEGRMMPTAVQGAVSYSAVIRLVNRINPSSKAKEPLNWTLWPGMNPSVDIIRRTHENTWKMPNAALNFQLDDHFITPAAKSKLERKPNDWSVVWVMENNKKPWPIFVRTTGTSGRDGKGETGISDGSYTEVLEWDPEFDPKPIAKDRATYPHVIIGAPPVPQSIFDKPTLKFS